MDREIHKQGLHTDYLDRVLPRKNENEQSTNGKRPSDTKDGYIIPWLTNILPLRSFVDFLPLYKPRKADYQIPLLTHELGCSFNQFINNLLYYQTNYMVLFVAMFIYDGYIDSLATIGGTIVLCTTGIVIWLCMNYLSRSPTSKNAVTIRDEYREDRYRDTDDITIHTVIIYSLILGLIVFAGVFIYYVMEFLICRLFFALFYIFLHAAVRRQNVEKELFETLGAEKLSKTPMGTVLEGFGVIKFTYKQQ